MLKKRVAAKFGIFTLTIFASFILAGQLWAAPITIKFATGMPADEEEGLHRGASVFKKVVEQKSGGRLKVDIYPSNQLGKEREQFEGVKLGTIEMSWIAEGPVAGFFPEIMALGIPYLYGSEAIAYRSLDGPYGKALMEEMRKKTGVRCLGNGENGFRHFSTRNKPIKSADDLKRLKIRVMESPVYMSMVASLGANPVPISWGEVYMALQQGVVDGWESPISLIESMKFNEITKYIIMDSHIYSFLPLLISDKFFLSLTPDLQSILVDATKMILAVNRGQNVRNVYNGIKNLEAKGMEIYVPTEKERQVFKDRTQKPVIEFLEKTFTEKKLDKKWIDQALKSAKDSEKE
jgi:TRAP-type transport system periplasmic protein